MMTTNKQHEICLQYNNIIRLVNKKNCGRLLDLMYYMILTDGYVLHHKLRFLCVFAKYNKRGSTEIIVGYIPTSREREREREREIIT